MKDKMNLSNRIALYSFMIFSIPVIISVIFVFIIIDVNLNNSAIKEAEQLAQSYANQLSTELNYTMDIARTLADSTENYEDIPAENRRKIINIWLKSAMKNNPQFLSVWATWEKGALEDTDQNYINSEFGNEIGRYSPTWYRDSGNIVLNNSSEKDIVDSDYYNIPRNTKRETVLEPYWYSYTESENDKVLETSMIAPVLKNGKYIGEIGIDISLDAIQLMVEKIKPYKQDITAVFSNGNIVAAHSIKLRAGKNMSISEKDIVNNNLGAYMKAVKEGHSLSFHSYSSYLKSDLYIISKPIRIGKTATPWSFMMGVPPNVLLAKVNGMLLILIISEVLCLMGIMVLIFQIARYLTKPVVEAIRSLHGNSEKVNYESGQIAAVEHELAEASAKQATSIEETSATLNQVALMTEKNLEIVKTVNSFAAQTSEMLKNANDYLQSMFQSMQDIFNKSQKTNIIVKNIDQIAFQTNLLALNAAVEAARAGDAGLGFAVVADEVRSLAKRSADAAKDTAELIEESLKNIKDGFTLAESAEKSFNDVVENAGHLQGLISELSLISHEQAEAISQASIVMTEMSLVTQNNAAHLEESAEATQRMKLQAELMMKAMEQVMRIVGDFEKFNATLKTALEEK